MIEKWILQPLWLVGLKTQAVREYAHVPARLRDRVCVRESERECEKNIQKEGERKRERERV